MVAKIHAGGRSFRGAVAYCVGEERGPEWRGEMERTAAGLEPTAERVAWIETRGMATADPRTAARQMAATAQYAGELKRLSGIGAGGRKLTKPVAHYTLSWAADERPDRMEMSQAVDESLKALGMEDRQAVVVAHDDKAHPHVHVVVNRVSAEDGRAASLGRSRLALSRWAERWERERGGIRCTQRVENNARRRATGDRVVAPAVSDARWHRWEQEKIERQAVEWRRGQNLTDALVLRVHERRAWDAVQRELAAEMRTTGAQQRAEWRELYPRQERERREAPGPETEERHLRERVALAREHARQAREIVGEADARYQQRVAAPIAMDDFTNREFADEAARMGQELDGESAAAFQRQVQGGAAPALSRDVERRRDRERDRGGPSW